MELKEDDVVLCTVIKIIKTTVFVKIEGNGEGSIITSEIAPGRIRNLRDYVVPNKKIVCKILRIGTDGLIALTLRRVSDKEKQEVLKKYETEKSTAQILKNLFKEKSTEIINKIKENSTLYDFLQEAKDKPEILKKLVGKKDSDKIFKLLSEKKAKTIEVKEFFYLKSYKSDGIYCIKKVLDIKDTNISYVAAGKFRIKIKADNFKQANLLISEIIEKIEQRARQEGCEFVYKK